MGKNIAQRVLHEQSPPLFLVFYLMFHSAYTSADQHFFKSLVIAAIERTRISIKYDGAYHAISYPNGDVPADIGVCTDLIIRAYRQLGIDLQVKVHEDIAANFDLYPAKRIWGQHQPDTNIDHRRVPNLATYFSRFGEILPISDQAKDYIAGDIVTWILPGNLPHIGIVTDKRSPDGSRPLIAHNIGAGPTLEDMLFTYPVSGHYRYPSSVQTQ